MSTGRALVLGGGGVAGIAWLAGMLDGLLERGVDLRTADLIVGTSAGSVVGTFVATGTDLAAEIDRIADQDASGTVPPPVPEDVMLAMFAVMFDETRDPAERRTEIGRMALDAQVDGAAAVRLAQVAEGLPSAEWPERRMLVTAVDTADGAFRVFDRDSGVPLPLAVTASCSVPLVFPPVPIEGRLYMDGGVRSATNADLAKGADAVVILEPLAYLMPRTALEREIAELGTANVAAIGPDQAAAEIMGFDVLDPTLWRPSFKAGLAQAPSAAAELAGIWNT